MKSRTFGYLYLAAMLYSVIQAYDANLGKRLMYYSSAAFCKVDTLLNWQCGKAC